MGGACCMHDREKLIKNFSWKTLKQEASCRNTAYMEVQSLIIQMDIKEVRGGCDQPSCNTRL